MANHEIELQVAPMSDETMDYLDTLFSVCKRFNTDYYHATQKERDFIDAVASHEYQLKRLAKKASSVQAFRPSSASCEASGAITCPPDDLKTSAKGFHRCRGFFMPTSESPFYRTLYLVYFSCRTKQERPGGGPQEQEGTP